MLEADGVAEAEGVATGMRSETMGGLAKGLAIIELFGAGAAALSVADAARGSGTTRAAARRCLLTLAELGYLEHDGRLFRPRPRLRRLGTTSDRRDLAQIAPAILASARDAIEETISLAILDQRDTLFIARCETPRIIQTGVRLGARLPAYATAAGRLLLADLPDHQIDSYLSTIEPHRRTSKSIVDKTALRAAIMDARQQGWSINDEELELGMRAIAVAVRAKGETIAAVTLSTLTLRAEVGEIAGRHRLILSRAAEDLAAAYLSGVE